MAYPMLNIWTRSDYITFWDYLEDTIKGRPFEADVLKLYNGLITNVVASMTITTGDDIAQALTKISFHGDPEKFQNQCKILLSSPEDLKKPNCLIFLLLDYSKATMVRKGYSS